MRIKQQTHLFFVFCFILMLTFQVEAKSKRKKVKLSTAGKIYVPKEIKPFKLSNTHKYDEKELGVSFEYKAEDIPVKYDYYIYPVDENISIEYAMMREYENVMYGIKYYAEKDDGQFSVLDSAIVHINKQRVISAITQMENPDRIYLSELYLTVINNHFIKLRATFPLSANKDYGLRDKTFHLFQGLLKQTQFKSKDKSEIGINLDAKVLNVKSDQGMLALMYAIAVQSVTPKDLILDYEQFLALYQKVTEVSKELIEQGKLKSNKLKQPFSLLTIEKAGFLREVIWLGYHQDYWKEPTGLKIIAFKEWIKIKGDSEISLRPKGVEVLIQR